MKPETIGEKHIKLYGKIRRLINRCISPTTDSDLGPGAMNVLILLKDEMKKYEKKYGISWGN